MLEHLLLHSDSAPSDVNVHFYRAHEGISLPYVVDIEISTADGFFVIDDCLQRRMLLEVHDSQGGVRYFDGLPDRVSFIHRNGDRNVFGLRLRPGLAVLEHREGSRIFQDKSPVDAVKEILHEAGVDKNVEWRLRQTYGTREFLCQYRETELNFIHRILEDEGIFYFFQHSADGHKLLFADDPSVFATQEGEVPVVLSPRQGVGAQPLLHFQRRRSLRPTSVVMRDFDFEKPDFFPEAAQPAPGPWSLNHFEYPGGFTAGAEGSRRARGRLSALRSDVDVCYGKSRAAGLCCAVPAIIEGSNESFLNGEFIITELRSEGRHGKEACENEFAAIPKDAPFAAPRRAKKSKIRGIQTAVITGPSNEPQAIHVDKYGRVKVRFFWDRSGKQDDTSSCWLRVSQLGLGGSMILPRVGWEVSVAFLEGDPDRPILLGRAYNAENIPPYAQPGAAADSSLKSMATPGGAGHNEIKMGDSAGKQGFQISSHKDFNVSTGHDKNETIAVDETHDIGSNYNVTVGTNEEVSIAVNQNIDVGDALQVKVTKSQTVTITGNDQVHAKCDFVEKVGGTRDYTIDGNQITISCGVRQDITGAFTREVALAQANISLASIDDTMLSTYDEKVGAVTVHLVQGVSAESVGTSKNLTSLAGELHIVPDFSTSANGVKQLIGGLHLQKIKGDLVVKAPTIVIGGASAKFKGGGSTVKLNGGPVTLKGSMIAIDSLLIVKLASDLKIG